MGILDRNIWRYAIEEVVLEPQPQLQLQLQGGVSWLDISLGGSVVTIRTVMRGMMANENTARQRDQVKGFVDRWHAS